VREESLEWRSSKEENPDGSPLLCKKEGESPRSAISDNRKENREIRGFSWVEPRTGEVCGGKDPKEGEGGREQLSRAVFGNHIAVLVWSGGKQ